MYKYITTILLVFIFVQVGQAQIFPIAKAQEETINNIFELDANDSNTFATFVDDHKAYELELKSGNIEQLWMPEGFLAFDVAVSVKKNLYALTGIGDNGVYIIDRSDHSIVAEYERSDKGYMRPVFFPNKPWIAFSHLIDGETFILDYSVQQLVDSFDAGGVHNMSVFPDEQKLLINAYVYDLKKKQRPFDVGGISDISTDGNQIYYIDTSFSPGNDLWKVVIQDAETGKVVNESPEFPYIPNGSITIAPNGNNFAAFSQAGTCQQS